MRSQNFHYVARIDELRFLASILVLVFHTIIAHSNPSGADSAIYIWFLEGHRGVNLFLALSGFLFTLIAGSSGHIDYRNFIFNRFLRIFPLLIFLFFITAAIYRTDWSVDNILGLLFLQFYLEQFRSLPPLGTTWTISVEFQFYLLFPFLHAFTNQYGIKYLFGLVVLFITMRLLCFKLLDNELAYFFTILGRFDTILVGMLAGRYYLKNNDCLQNLYTLPLGLIAMTWVLLNVKTLGNGPWALALYPPFEAALWCLLIISFINFPFSCPLLEKVMAKFGEVSYSMYLLHLLVILNLSDIKLLSDPFMNAFLISWVIILPATLALSFLTYYLIEKPFLGFRKKYLIQ